MSNNNLREGSKDLTGPGDQARPAIQITIVAIDIAGATRMTAEMSAVDRYLFLTGWLGLVQHAIDATKGRLLRIKRDGVIAAFDAPAKALDFVACTQLATWARNASDERAIAFRTGACIAGPGIHSAGAFSALLELAARLCDAARPTEILTSHALYGTVAQHPGLRFGGPRTVALTGRASVIAHPLRWA